MAAMMSDKIDLMSVRLEDGYGEDIPRLTPRKIAELRSVYPSRRIETWGDLADFTFREFRGVPGFGEFWAKRCMDTLYNSERVAPSGLGGPGVAKSVPVETAPILEVGLNLRDQFALQCLHGIIDDCGLSADEMAKRCYEVADAMLRAREAPKCSICGKQTDTRGGVCFDCATEAEDGLSK